VPIATESLTVSPNDLGSNFWIFRSAGSPSCCARNHHKSAEFAPTVDAALEDHQGRTRPHTSVSTTALNLTPVVMQSQNTGIAIFFYEITRRSISIYYANLGR
jgi:hypothetical protein